MEYLVITAQGNKSQAIVTKIAELATDMDCHVVQAEATNLGSETTCYALFQGQWNTIAKLETALKALTKELGLLLTLSRTKSTPYDADTLAYTVQVISINQTNTLFNVCNFFTSRNILIESLNAESYEISLSNTAMLAINLAVSLSAQTNIAELREQFMLFCEDLNIDGIIEPTKRL